MMHMDHAAIIEKYQCRLSELLASPNLKYSSWPPSEIAPVRQSAGIYHFFEIHDGCVTSLYVGKGSFGSGEEWNLYERMKQHFQPSQKYALLGKASRAKGVSPEDAKKMFNESNVYLQWLVFGTTSEADGSDIEAELRGFEHFAIAILKPTYTDA